jgi:group I intron endonuclease
MKLQRAWYKYGEDAFVFEKVLFCDKHCLLIYEQLLIDAYCCSTSAGYNTQPIAGSRLGSKMTDVSKAKLSAIVTGRKHSVTTKEKIATQRTQWAMSDEGRASYRARGIKIGGQKRSDISKKRMSEANIGIRQKAARNSVSGIAGVYPDKKGKWFARIVYNHKSIHLGTFSTKEEAAQARKEAELAYRTA